MRYLLPLRPSFPLLRHSLFPSFFSFLLPLSFLLIFHFPSSIVAVQPFTSDGDGKFAFARQPNAMSVNIAVLGELSCSKALVYRAVLCCTVLCCTVLPSTSSPILSCLVLCCVVLSYTILRLLGYDPSTLIVHYSIVISDCVATVCVIYCRCIVGLCGLALFCFLAL